MTEGRLDAARFIEQLAPEGDDDRPRLGTIPSGYSSGRPTILFDGETVVGSKQYPYLSSYAPAAGHRVLLLPVGTSYVIIGRVV